MIRTACAAAIAVVIAAPAFAQAVMPGPACVKRDELVKHLTGQYQEAPAAVGIAYNGTLLEVFASKSGETWTVMLTMPNGISCMVASGQQWQDIPRVAHLGAPI